MLFPEFTAGELLLRSCRSALQARIAAESRSYSKSFAMIGFIDASEGYCNVGGCASSSSTVWFDNVTVSAIPVPAAAWLFSSGLPGLTGIAKRKKTLKKAASAV